DSIAGNIFINGENTLNVDRVRAEAGDVHLHAIGSIFDARQDSAASIIGTNLELLAVTPPTNGAPTATLGNANKPLMIDSSFAAKGTVTAQADGAVFLTEVAGGPSSRAGDLRVNTIRSLLADVFLVADRSIYDANGPGTGIPNATNVTAT